MFFFFFDLYPPPFYFITSNKQQSSLSSIARNWVGKEKLLSFRLFSRRWCCWLHRCNCFPFATLLLTFLSYIHWLPSYIYTAAAALWEEQIILLADLLLLDSSPGGRGRASLKPSQSSTLHYHRVLEDCHYGLRYSRRSRSDQLFSRPPLGADDWERERSTSTANDYNIDGQLIKYKQK